MNPAPRCVECRIERVPVEVEWASPRYQISSYECPACKSVMRLVERRVLEPTYH